MIGIYSAIIQDYGRMVIVIPEVLSVSSMDCDIRYLLNGLVVIYIPNS